MRQQDAVISVAAVAWMFVLSTACERVAQSAAENHDSSTAVKEALPTRVLPEFICTVRAYGGAGYGDFQRSSMKELGLDYVQGLVDFAWGNIERGDNVWKWIATDDQMDQFAKSGLKVIAFLLCPKSTGLPWDETVKFFDYDFDTKISGAYNEPAPPFVYRFRGRNKPSDMLWVAFSGPGTNKRKPVIQDAMINIAPASRAALIDMLGAQRVLQPDSSGNVTITAGRAPIYLKAGE